MAQDFIRLSINSKTKGNAQVPSYKTSKKGTGECVNGAENC